MTYTQTDHSMTKTRARELAKQARRYGYFHNGIDVWVKCPVCDVDVHGFWDTSTRMQRSLTQELDRMVIDHIDDEACNEAPHPRAKVYDQRTGQPIDLATGYPWESMGG